MTASALLLLLSCGRQGRGVACVVTCHLSRTGDEAAERIFSFCRGNPSTPPLAPCASTRQIFLRFPSSQLPTALSLSLRKRARY